MCHGTFPYFLSMNEHDTKHQRYEMMATILMAVATIATAWCAYQSTVWSGLQEFEMHDAQELSREVNTLRTIGLERSIIDLSLFESFLDAHLSGNQQLAEFYRQRFPPRLKVPFESWWATEPFTNPNAPSHVFAMKNYVVSENVRADSLHKVALTAMSRAHESNAHSEHYILLTVIFASVLFFGGITSNIHSLGTKAILVWVSTALLIGSCVWMLTFPTVLR